MDAKYNQTSESPKKVSNIKDTISTVNLFLTLIGIIGNFLCILIFSRKKIRTNRFNLYLLALAVSELMFCLVLFIENMCRLVHPDKVYLRDINIYLNLLVDFLFRTTDSYNILIMLFLSIDRLYGIKKPIKMKNFITHLHAKRIILAALVFLLLIQVATTAVRQKIEPVTFYILLIIPMIFNVIPVIIILMVNLLLIYELFHYYKSEEEKNENLNISSSQALNRQLTITSFTKKSQKNDNLNNCCNSQGLSRVSTCTNFSLLARENRKSDSRLLQYSSSKRKLSKLQKSHYFVIVVLALWLVLTTVPYHAFNSMYLILNKSLAENNATDVKNSKQQSISKLGEAQVFLSVFFNSNHFFNFFVYFHFYSMFRKRICNFFCKLFRCKTDENFTTCLNLKLVNSDV